MAKIMIRSVTVSECYTNCYICMNKDTKEGFIVDPGDDELKISVNVSRPVSYTHLTLPTTSRG